MNEICSFVKMFYFVSHGVELGVVIGCCFCFMGGIEGFKITYDKSTLSLLESGEQHSIKVIK